VYVCIYVSACVCKRACWYECTYTDARDRPSEPKKTSTRERERESARERVCDKEREEDRLYEGERERTRKRARVSERDTLGKKDRTHSSRVGEAGMHTCKHEYTHSHIEFMRTEHAHAQAHANMYI